jgi:predicted nucleic acid-binding protein
MGFVVDASVTMAWCFEDEVDMRAERALDRLRTEDAYVPSVWPLEVANVLIVAERRGRLTASQSAQFLALLRSLPITVDAVAADGIWDAVMDLARSHQLSSHDACYLELARRLALPLAAADGRIRNAAGVAAITLLE